MADNLAEIDRGHRGVCEDSPNLLTIRLAEEEG